MKELISAIAKRVLAALVGPDVAAGEASDAPQVLRVDVADNVCYALTGEITPSGRSHFEIVISNGHFTTVYETPSYAQAQRWYAKVVRGSFPVGHTLAR